VEIKAVKRNLLILGVDIIQMCENMLVYWRRLMLASSQMVVGHLVKTIRTENHKNCQFVGYGSISTTEIIIVLLNVDVTSSGIYSNSHFSILFANVIPDCSKWRIDIGKSFLFSTY
jgi:hypothetical protein